MSSAVHPNPVGMFSLVTAGLALPALSPTFLLSLFLPTWVIFSYVLSASNFSRFPFSSAYSSCLSASSPTISPHSSASLIDSPFYPFLTVKIQCPPLMEGR